MTEREAWLWLAKLWREGGGTIAGRVGLCVVIDEIRERGDIDFNVRHAMMIKVTKYAPMPRHGHEGNLCWPLYDWHSRAEFCERMAEKS